MWSNRLINGRYLGVLLTFMTGSAAQSTAIDAVAATSSAITSAPATMVLAQNVPDRTNEPVNIPNTAKVSLQMSPDRTVPVGSRISFRVTTRKPGYLLLVDIDADGKMSQIFPSPEMIVQSEEGAANFLRPGEELVIPNSAAQKKGFEYIITPPTGSAAVVAILSERRVQLLDLPDDAQKPRTETETISYLAGWTSGLRVPDAGTGKMQPSNWSFDIKPYSIR
jgi:hypothetical protein